MKYRVITVEADSNHWLAQYVEDDEDLFVIDEKEENWCLAVDFFAVSGIKEFTAK